MLALLKVTITHALDMKGKYLKLKQFLVSQTHIPPITMIPDVRCPCILLLSFITQKPYLWVSLKSRIRRVSSGFG